jgi:Flp pilus assembly protein TadD
LHNYLGIVLHDRNRNEQAIRELRRSVELDGTNIEARFNLAVLLATSDKPSLDEARRQYETAMKMGGARDETLDRILFPNKKP